MNKQTERISKQLLELSEAVNAFNSETVQIKVISRVIRHLDHLNQIEEGFAPFIIPPGKEELYRPIDDYQVEFLKDQAPIFLALKRVAASGFLKFPKTTVDVANYINQKEGAALYPKDVKSYLIKMMKRNVICGVIDPQTSRYVFTNRGDVDPSVFL